MEIVNEILNTIESVGENENRYTKCTEKSMHG